ncbi:hypothetical protein L596_008587 [Steinernema carpocapsae]|uniref:SESTD1-like spectrin repeats region domain-containing protein n=1 Tax=Steinernema carpocapsae TaxID=34508 RepID=A0A4U5PCY6_STECR|nr:hypothetical protein L596_008587 [Steinernema carpocapsae]
MHLIKQKQKNGTLRSKKGHSLVVIGSVLPSNVDLSSLQAVEGCSSETLYYLSYSVLRFIADSVFDQRKTICVVVDAQQILFKNVIMILKACQNVPQVVHAIVITSGTPAERQKMTYDLNEDQFAYKISLTSVFKLYKHIELSVLPDNLGGRFSLSDKESKDFHPIFSAWLNHNTAWGENIAFFNQFSVFVDRIVIRETLSVVDFRFDKPLITIPEPLKTISENDRCLSPMSPVPDQMIRSHMEAMTELLDWVKGSGNKWFNALNDVGESLDEVKVLEKEHNLLYNKSHETLEEMEAFSKFTDFLIENPIEPNVAKDLRSLRDEMKRHTEMHFRCVEAQGDLIAKSLHFYTLVNDFSRKFDAFLKSSAPSTFSFSLSNEAEVDVEKEALKRKTDEIEKHAALIAQDGALLISEILTRKQTESVDAELAKCYAIGIARIEEQLARTRDSQRRCDDMVDLRLLKLNQMTQLIVCVRDAEQVIQWLEEIYANMLINSGVSLTRIQLGKSEEIGKSTYAYGRELCQVALLLSRSLRLPTHEQLRYSNRLDEVWRRFDDALWKLK